MIGWYNNVYFVFYDWTYGSRDLCRDRRSLGGDKGSINTGT